MIVSALAGEKGALKQAQYRQAWGKDATTLEEYDYYLRGHEEYMKYAQGDKRGSSGRARFGEKDWRSFRVRRSSK